MDKELIRLAGDKATLEAFRDFLILSIKRQAGEMAVKGKDTSHVADAANLISEAFIELTDTYGPKQPAKPEGTNEAR